MLYRGLSCLFVFFLEKKKPQGMKLTSYPFVGLSLRIQGSIPPLPHMPSYWGSQWSTVEISYSVLLSYIFII